MNGSALHVEGLLVDGLESPLAVAPERPSLSWRLSSPDRGVRQTAFRVQVSGPDGVAWDSGFVASSESAHVTYDGEPLRSHSTYSWRVQVQDDRGRESPWSEEASWETALTESDWEARWIGFAEPDEVTEPPFPSHSPASYLRRVFDLPLPVRRARAHVSAAGVYELRLNGAPVGSQRLAPGWTDYRRRIQYQTYDVTAMLNRGPNAVGAIVADGWFAGHVACYGRWQYGDGVALVLQLEAELEDGSTFVLPTDGTWQGAVGPIVAADLIMGERFDARVDLGAWDTSAGEPDGWRPVQLRAAPGGPLVPQPDEGIEVVEEVAPVSIEARAGSFIVDLGQNIAGTMRLDVEGKPGSTVILRHAEMLEPDGSLHTANLRRAAQRDEYVLSGGRETIEPRFTYHGFRYAEIEGPVEQVRPEDVRALVLSSAIRRTGIFECSDPLLNRLQENIVRGQRGNFMSIPTDCPQRDERLGWTGDAQVFAGTAAFNFDVRPFFRKWLVDLEDAQLVSGAYPDVAPVVGQTGGGNAGWADAGVIIPWTIYLRYGDRSVLERHYPSMRRYVEFLRQDSTGFIRSAGRYGDWVSLGPPTPKDLIGTAYFAHSVDLVSKIAAILGETRDEAVYSDLFDEIRAAFAASFVEEDGWIAGRTQTGAILALHMELVPAGLRPAVAGRLAADVEERGGHLTTGFLGTPLALPVLSANGYHELACRVAQADTFPSWGFSIRHGATTIWERWDAWTVEDGFKDPTMNSFNHYALGSVGDWLYRFVGGLDVDEGGPGYSRFRIRPGLGGTIDAARVELDSVHGRIASSWKLSGGTLELALTVPPNTVADVELPVGDHAKVIVDGEAVGSNPPEGVAVAADRRSLSVGSGRYSLSVRGE